MPNESHLLLFIQRLTQRPRFPIPDSRFPTPDSRLPVPCSRFPVPYRFNHDLQSTARHYHRGLQWDWQSYCQIISPEGS
ncbi:MAG: hypothetical protein F6K50_37540 [Moorea sp. SIO3I7]|nr:hypothetical protein [Moorena sp. SIO3I7]